MFPQAQAISEHNRPPSPLTILRKGRSDPFDVYAVPITPVVNMLLTYARDFYHPATNRDAVNLHSSDPYRSRRWAGYVSYLHDECTALAYLTQIVSAMSPGDLREQKQVKVEALKFQVKSVEQLRQRLIASPNEPTTLHAIVILLGAAVYDRQVEIGKRHTAILAQLFRTSHAATDHLLVFEALFRDNQLAAESLTRPFFDVEGWIAHTFASLFESLVEALPENVTVAAAAKGTDPTLDDIMLQDHLARARHILLVYHLCMSNPTYSTPLHLFYMRFRVASSINKLLNAYMDSVQSFESDIYRVRVWSRVRAYTSLASVVWIRTMAMIDNMYISPGHSVLKANYQLLAKAKEILTEHEEIFMADSQAQYARLRLFALYVGAYEEQVRQQRGEGKAAGHWFNVKLVEHAKAMQLVTWDAVTEVLLGFLYTDVLQPHGSTWFDADGGVGRK